MLVHRKGTPDTQVYAMKTLNKRILLKKNQIAHTKTEREILQKINHPYIVSLVTAFQSPAKLYLVTEFAAGGELFFWLKRDRRFSQSRARLYTAEIILALEHLHERGIVYRDLKPENILLDAEGHIKVTDFGLSKANIAGAGAEGGTKTFCGTPEYLAPEILEQKGHGKAVDWWSLGTLLYEMMNGLPPFYDQNMQRMYEKILHSELRFPPHFSREARSLLRGMLERNVADRLGSVKDAEDLKSHPFFAGLDWEAVARRGVKPEFTPPKLSSPTDTRYFDPEFTTERPKDTHVDASAISATQADKTHFDDFTYDQSAPVDATEDDE